MCGIVGYVGHRQVVDILIQGLKRLEYRGYDSAGIALLCGDQIEIKKSEGRLENVEKLLNGSAKAFSGATCGIGHTRWATHGKPTTQNAHPHRADHVVLVHNGIIENYQQIRKEVLALGYHLESETDSELLGYLVLHEMEKGSKLSLVEAVRKSFFKIQGACSAVFMSEEEPGVVVGVRNGSPLVVALDPKGGAIIASDAQPLIEISRDVIFLEHGDLVVGTRESLTFFELETGKQVKRSTTRLDWSIEKMDKQGFPHYMLKEIYEQPTALVDTLNGILDRTTAEPFILAEQPAAEILSAAKELTLVGCGSAWHSAVLGKYWLEQWARIPVNIELASEFRYRSSVLNPGSVVIGVSQSGETADTLAVVREMKKRSVPTIAITNSRGSTLSREANATIFTSAGPEISVAGTKSFMTQMLSFVLLSGSLGRKKNQPEIRELFDDVLKLPHLLADYLEIEGPLVQSVRDSARALQKMKGFFFIGRGFSFPLALEGALKLKEIAYVHAEGYAAGELKHGPIAMIDETIAVVVLAPKDQWHDKTVSNLEEVKARGAKILAVGDANDEELKELCDHWIGLPQSEGRPIHSSLRPLLLTPVLQLLSYELALLKGTNVDKPRNLAKSVTVE